MVEEHFIKGNTFADWADFARRLSHFAAEVLNARIHGTTQERPQDRLLSEQQLLLKLPATRFISCRECFRKVSLDCLVAYGGSRYSVPWQYAGKHVWLRPTQDSGLEILASTGETLARHQLSQEKGKNVVDLKHYQGLRENSGSSKHQLSCLFQRRFPEAAAGRFLEKLLAQYRMNAQVQLQRILALLQSYPRETLLLAFEQALSYNTFSYRFLCGLLSQQESAVNCRSRYSWDRNELCPSSMSNGDWRATRPSFLRCPMTETERLKANLEQMGLKRMAGTFETEAERAAQLKTSYSGYLGRLVEEELLAKTDRSVNYRIKKATFRT